MRFLVLVTVLAATLALPAQTAAISVCPTSEFKIEFEAGSAAIDPYDVEMLDAATNRARQCDISAFVLHSAGLSDVQQARLSRLEQELAARGINPERIRRASEGELPRYATHVGADEIVAMIYFNQAAQCNPRYAPD